MKNYFLNLKPILHISLRLDSAILRSKSGLMLNLLPLSNQKIILQVIEIFAKRENIPRIQNEVINAFQF